MYLTVGEISKTLGISNEMVRYYVKEGLLKPKKNEKNAYWEYSSDDLIKLTDILFYRDMGLSIKEIGEIMGGMEVDAIGELLNKKKSELINEIKAKINTVSKLDFWVNKYNDEISLLNNFRIAQMPSELLKDQVYDPNVHLAKYIQGNLKIRKEDWMDVSVSFRCNIFEEELKLEKYLSVEKNESTIFYNMDEDVIEEKAEHCICTQVFYSEDPLTMISPLIKFAEENNYQLQGLVFGRENTNFYINDKRNALYRLYAPIIST